jgi:CRP-like cAMP-binding protein
MTPPNKRSKAELLQRGFLFRRFSAEELDLVLATLVGERKVPQGKHVFEEGEQATALYVVEAGEIEIIKSGEGGTQFVVSLLKDGDLLGEMAFVDRAPRAAMAQAKVHTYLLEITYERLERAIAVNPALGLKLYQAIAETLCSRIRRTTSDLTSLLLS